MRKDKHKIQIGDVLYEASKMYQRVIKWEVIDVWLEHYIGYTKTIVLVRSELLGKAERFVSEVLAWMPLPEPYKKGGK